MILKLDAFLRDLAQLRERENLITAAIGQDWPVPVHKAMQAAEMPHHLHSRPNEKVIGVAENDLRFELAQFARTDRFHAPWVPTGMKAGVSITPCAVVRRPRRALRVISAEP